MNENTESMEKLLFERQTVETEIKNRRKAFKKLESDTLQQIRELDLKTQHYAELLNCQTEAYNKYTAQVRETIAWLNEIMRNKIAAAKGEADDMTAELVERLQLRLLDKARAENAAMVKLNDENEKLSDEIPERAQKLVDAYNREKEAADTFAEQARQRIEELEESITNYKPKP